MLRAHRAPLEVRQPIFILRRAVMIQRAIRSVVVFCAVTSCLGARIASAQTVGASLQGIVTDPTGAPIPNADVVVIATATGGTWELKTDSSGHYRVPVLQPGEY